MKRFRQFLKLLVPLLAAIYGFAVIYVTAMPLADVSGSFGREVLTWLLTLVAIGVTFLIVTKVEPLAFPEVREFSLKPPAFSICIGLLCITPLWVVLKEGIIYGFTSCIHSVQLEPVTYTAEELREDLIASVHAVLLAPVLEELCYRQLAIAPFRRRWTQVIVCVVMAVLFGVLHVRNFSGAFLSAMVYGLAFILTRNIWYPILLHAGCNLTSTLAAVYCTIGIGEIRMSKTPVILMGDTKFIVASVVLAVIGVIILYRGNVFKRKNETTSITMKKVIIISTSLRPGSNSHALAEQFAKGAEAAGHQVELISLRGKEIKFCIGCLSCQKTGACVIKDDVPAIMEGVLNADVVCWTTPIYYYEMSGQMKTLIDRMNAMYPKDYNFRDVYLLATATENEEGSPKRAETGLTGWIDCFPKSRLAGTLFCGGVTMPRDIEGNGKLQEAYELGKNV